MSTLSASVPTVNASDLTFGIEIECCLPTAAMQSAGINVGGYHCGQQIPGLPAGWNAQSDCSIQPFYGFRGIFDLHSRKPGMLNYTGKAGRWTLAEGFAWWQRKSQT